MLRERRVGFMLDEVMTGTHHFVNKSGPAGEHPMSFRVTWGTRHLASYINPFNPGFMSNWLEGTVTVGGLVTDAPCRGTLDLAYFTEAKIRYTFDFLHPGGDPFEGDPRYILKRNLKRAADMGYTFYVGPELEYFYFRDDQGTPYRYIGEKVNLRPWNLHKTHTTCYGTIVNLKNNKEVSKSIVYFKFETTPEFMASFRLG